MEKLDLRWMDDMRWFHHEGNIVVIHDDAPDYVKESFANYCKQLAEKYGDE